MLLSACDVRLRLRDNWIGFETHDKGGKKEDRKGECVKGREKIYLSALPVSLLNQSRAGKVVSCYTRWSSHEEAEHDS